MNEEEQKLLEIAEEEVKKCEPSIKSFFQYLLDSAKKQLGEEIKGIQLFYFMRRNIDYLLLIAGSFFSSMVNIKSGTEEAKEFVANEVINCMKKAFLYGFTSGEKNGNN